MSTSQMVMSVKGIVPAEDLGMVALCEYMLYGLVGWENDPWISFDRPKAFDSIVGALREFKEAGGTTMGIIPGEDKEDANAYVDIIIPTGMGYSRNALVAASGDIIVALTGKYGTLAEIGFALNSKKPVYGFNAWEIPGIIPLSEADELKDILEKQ